MKLRARLLRLVRTVGPVKHSILRGIALAKHPGEDFDQVFAEMRRRGEIVMHGRKKGARWPSIGAG